MVLWCRVRLLSWIVLRPWLPRLTGEGLRPGKVLWHRKGLGCGPWCRDRRWSGMRLMRWRSDDGCRLRVRWCVCGWGYIERMILRRHRLLRRRPHRWRR
jgi:hypothetical protein